MTKAGFIWDRAWIETGLEAVSSEEDRAALLDHVVEGSAESLVRWAWDADRSLQGAALYVFVDVGDGDGGLWDILRRPGELCCVAVVEGEGLREPVLTEEEQGLTALLRRYIEDAVTEKAADAS